MYEVIGFRYVDMTDDDGREIKGHSVFFAVEEDADGLTGRSTCKVFFPASKYPDFRPQVGDLYDLFFNQRRRLPGYRAAV